ncbi:MAG: hypothetical protein V4805_12600 [Pseudomonadota bacterium]
MPQDLRIRVGVEVATITINGTAQQVAAALERYASSQGITITGTATENLTAILEHIKVEVRRRSKEVQKAQLEAANAAAIEATVELDNPI